MSEIASISLILRSTAFAVFAFSASASASSASVAMPQPPLEFILSGVSHPIETRAIDVDEIYLVDVRILNHGAEPRRVTIAPHVDALLMIDGHAAKMPVQLQRARETPATITIAPNGFARLRYRLADLPAPLKTTGLDNVAAYIQVPHWGGRQMAAMGKQGVGAEGQTSHALAPASAHVRPALMPEQPAKPAPGRAMVVPSVEGASTGMQQASNNAHTNGGASIAGVGHVKLARDSGVIAGADLDDSGLHDETVRGAYLKDRPAPQDFVSNISTYEPIYALYGPGTNTEARIQISFKYRLFGTRIYKDKDPSWREGLYFAFTQRMFWDLAAKSSPFRNIDYLPEIFYSAPATVLRNGMTIAGQAGLKHESNGRDGVFSRSLNSIYIAPMGSWDIAGGYRLKLAPRAMLLIGNRSDNHDIQHYRGTTSLYAELGSDDGWRFTTITRYNFSSGKGSVLADTSYPLTNIWEGGPDLYLFGQGFVGYGENLLDYNKRTTRLRIGFGIAR